MQTKTTIRKSPHVSALEAEKFDGECFVTWLRDELNDGATHEQIIEKLNALPGDPVKPGTLSKWINTHLERRYVIRGGA